MDMPLSVRIQGFFCSLVGCLTSGESCFCTSQEAFFVAKCYMGLAGRSSAIAGAWGGGKRLISAHENACQWVYIGYTDTF